MLCIGMMTAVNALAASSTVEGYVKDSQTGEPLQGATVMLVGTGMGTATRLDGEFTIRDVPPGEYKLRTVYVGYRTKVIPVKVQSGVLSKVSVKLLAIGVNGKKVLITGQAGGQSAAINQELSSDRIENVVSAKGIQALPDANAAEAVGRLPGVSLLRTGGQANEVVIRGLAPQYNQITIDGVRIPGNNYDNRGVDLSMISSSMLGGIQVTKAITPDMDAAVLGGVVNFTLPEATTRKAQVRLLVQGAYDNLDNTYNDYKFDATFEKRFFDNRFGILAEGDVERQDVSANEMAAYYGLDTKIYAVQNKAYLVGMSLTDLPMIQRRYDGTLVMDYRLNEGSIGLMNFFSYGINNSVSREEQFNLIDNSINSSAGGASNHIYSLNTARENLISTTSLLDFQKQLSALNVHLKIHNAFSQGRVPYLNSWDFGQYLATGFNTYSDASLSPQHIPTLAHDSLQITYFGGAMIDPSILRQNNLGASLDLKTSVNFSSQITSVLKFGGAFTFADRSFNSALYSGGLSNPGGIQELEQEYPWIRASFDKYTHLILPVFADSSFSYGNFLGGGYKMGLPIDLGKMEQVLRIAEKTATSTSWNFNSLESITNNYLGREYRSAGYGMITFHFGPDLTFLPGIRYQVLQTLYTAPRGRTQINRDSQLQYDYYDTTMDLAHGFWLPMVHLIYNPAPWLQIHLAYTNTITYPSFTDITPELAVETNSIIYHNFLLKPGTSANYEAIVFLYGNKPGLLSVDGFYKRIDNFIFGTGTTYMINTTQYPDIPSYAEGYPLTTSINDPYPAYVYGAEFDWRTHFWYLPGLLSGLVLDVNYTHVYSTAKYPYTYLIVKTINKYPYQVADTINTFYPDRLIDQPSDIMNFTVGYDLGGFSVRVSMRYTDNVFSAANFWPALRSSTAQKTVWDAEVNQNLPWDGLQVYMGLNNINSAEDLTINQGSTFPSYIDMYGMTAKLGLRMGI